MAQWSKNIFVQYKLAVTAMLDTQGKIAGAALFTARTANCCKAKACKPISLCGLYHHKETGLCLLLTEVYKPIHCEMANRDPIEEKWRLNLYSMWVGIRLGYVDFMGYMKLFFGSQRDVKQCSISDQKLLF